MTTTHKPGTRSEQNYRTDPGDPWRAATIGGVREQLSADAVSRLAVPLSPGLISTAGGSVW
jgi:hypothetical protein